MGKLAKNIGKFRAEGFWDYVRLNIVTGCWEWTGGFCDGYGVVHRSPFGTKAHRISYGLHYGGVPKNLVLMHKCDNRACVNPYHLEAGTHAENIRDMDRKGRRANRRLSHAQIEEMRSKAGANHRQLAQEYGVVRSHVSRIMRYLARTEDKTL